VRGSPRSPSPLGPGRGPPGRRATPDAAETRESRDERGHADGDSIGDQPRGGRTGGHNRRGARAGPAAPVAGRPRRPEDRGVRGLATAAPRIRVRGPPGNQTSSAESRERLPRPRAEAVCRLPLPCALAQAACRGRGRVPCAEAACRGRCAACRGRARGRCAASRPRAEAVAVCRVPFFRGCEPRREPSAEAASRVPRPRAECRGCEPRAEAASREPRAESRARPTRRSPPDAHSRLARCATAAAYAWLLDRERAGSSDSVTRFLLYRERSRRAPGGSSPRTSPMGSRLRPTRRSASAIKSSVVRFGLAATNSGPRRGEREFRWSANFSSLRCASCPRKSPRSSTFSRHDGRARAEGVTPATV